MVRGAAIIQPFSFSFSNRWLSFHIRIRCMWKVKSLMLCFLLGGVMISVHWSVFLLSGTGSDFLDSCHSTISWLSCSIKLCCSYLDLEPPSKAVCWAWMNANPHYSLLCQFVADSIHLPFFKACCKTSGWFFNEGEPLQARVWGRIWFKWEMSSALDVALFYRGETDRTCNKGTTPLHYKPPSLQTEMFLTNIHIQQHV